MKVRAFIRMICVFIFGLSGLLLPHNILFLREAIRLFHNVPMPVPWQVWLVPVLPAVAMIGSATIFALTYRWERQQSRRGFPVQQKSDGTSD